MIHYREASLNPGRSLGSGERLGSASPDQKRVLGVVFTKPRYGRVSTQIRWGRLTQDMTDGELLKDAFWYNGALKVMRDRQPQWVLINPTKDPHVMNNFDAKHKNMGIITRDYGGIDGKDTRDSAYTVFVLLRNGKFDESGRVTSLGYCKPVVPSDGGIKEVVGDGGPMGQRLIQIAQSYIGKITKYSQSRRTSFLLAMQIAPRLLVGFTRCWFTNGYALDWLYGG